MFHYTVSSLGRNDNSLNHFPELTRQGKISSLSITLFLGTTVGKITVCVQGEPRPFVSHRLWDAKAAAPREALGGTKRSNPGLCANYNIHSCSPKSVCLLQTTVFSCLSCLTNYIRNITSGSPPKSQKVEIRKNNVYFHILGKRYRDGVSILKFVARFVKIELKRP